MTRILFIKYGDITKNIFYKSILKMKINLSNTATLRYHLLYPDLQNQWRIQDVIMAWAAYREVWGRVWNKTRNHPFL